MITKNDLEALEAMAGPGARAEVDYSATGLVVRVAGLANGRIHFYRHIIPGTVKNTGHWGDYMPMQFLESELRAAVAESRR